MLGLLGEIHDVPTTYSHSAFFDVNQYPKAVDAQLCVEATCGPSIFPNHNEQERVEELWSS